MFCNVSYFHFARHKEKFMWGSYFTFIFPFPRAGFGLSDKTDGPSYILLLGKGEHYFQRWTLQNDQSDSCSEKHQVLFKTSLIFPFTICHLSRRNYSCLYVGDGWWIYIIPIKTLVPQVVDLLSEQQLENIASEAFLRAPDIASESAVDWQEKSWRLFGASSILLLLKRIKVAFETLAHKCHRDSHFESNIIRGWLHWKGTSFVHHVEPFFRQQILQSISDVMDNMFIYRRGGLGGGNLIIHNLYIKICMRLPFCRANFILWGFIQNALGRRHIWVQILLWPSFKFASSFLSL